MLSNKTIKRIADNADMGRETIIGRYTYRVDHDGYTIQRAKTEDKDRMWITWDGQQVGAWEPVARI